MIEKIKNYFHELKNMKWSPILTFLFVFRVVCLLIANIIAAKTFVLFSIGKGAEAFEVLMPSAVFLYPFIYIISDVMSEAYSYKVSRISTWLSFGMNLFMVLCFEIAIVMPGQTDLSVLGSTWFLLLSSLLSYMVGAFVDDRVFRKLKYKDGRKGLLGRCLISSVCGQLIDSAIYLPLGMYLFPLMIFGYSWMTPLQLLVCILLQPVIKVVVESLVAPFTKWLSKKLLVMELKAGNIYDPQYIELIKNDKDINYVLTGKCDCGCEDKQINMDEWLGHKDNEDNKEDENNE